MKKPLKTIRNSGNNRKKPYLYSVAQSAGWRKNEQLQQFSLGERLLATEAKLLEFLLGSR